MDFKTETQLRREIADAWRLVDQYKRSAEVHAAERDHARACYERAVRLLTSIHALLYPPPINTADGRTMVFRPKDPHQVLQELSDRIRSLPDEIDAISMAATNEAKDRGMGNAHHYDSHGQIMSHVMKDQTRQTERNRYFRSRLDELQKEETRTSRSKAGS